MEAGLSQVHAAGREGGSEPGQCPSRLCLTLEIIPTLTLLSTDQLQPLGSACFTHHLIDPHNHCDDPITQMRKARSREVEWLASYQVAKWDLSPGLPESTVGLLGSKGTQVLQDHPLGQLHQNWRESHLLLANQSCLSSLICPQAGRLLQGKCSLSFPR